MTALRLTLRLIVAHGVRRNQGKNIEWRPLNKKTCLRFIRDVDAEFYQYKINKIKGTVLFKGKLVTDNTV